MKRVCQSILAGFLASGIFVVALWMGRPSPSFAASAPPSRTPPGSAAMPVYPGAYASSLGDHLSLNGVPLQVSTFVTKDSPERVAQFFRTALRPFGSPQEQWSSEGGVIEVVQPLLGMTRTVMIRRENGGCRVFASVVPFTAMPVRLLPAPDPEVPYGGGSVAAMEVAEHGRPRQGRTAIFHEAARVETVRARIHAWMKEHQWNPVQEYGDDLRYRRQGESAHIQLKAFQGTPPLTSVVYQAYPDDE